MLTPDPSAHRMFPSSLDGVFQNINLPYGMMLPVGVCALLSLVALAGMIRGANAWDVAYATYCYFAQAVGVILIATGSVPVLHAVLSSQLLDNDVYLGLLFAFALGGILFLWHDAKLRHIDASAKAIPHALFFFTWKLISLMIAAYALMTLSLVTILFITTDGATFPMQHGYVLLTMLIFGLCLGWFTLVSGPTHRPSVTTRILGPIMSPSMAAKAKKPVAKKTAKRKR